MTLYRMLPLLLVLGCASMDKPVLAIGEKKFFLVKEEKNQKVYRGTSTPDEIEVINTVFPNPTLALQGFYSKRLLTQTPYERLPNPYAFNEEKNVCMNEVNVKAPIEKFHGRDSYAQLVAVTAEGNLDYCQDEEVYRLLAIRVFLKDAIMTEVRFQSQSNKSVKDFFLQKNVPISLLP